MRGAPFILAALLAAGCAPQSAQLDGGAGDANAATGTVGDQCTKMYTALCTHSISDCALSGFTLNDCVQSGKTQCCADKCGANAITPDRTITVCANALATEPCNDVAQNTIPAICQGLPQKQ